MELYFNNKTYNLQSNILYESSINEDENNKQTQENIEDKIDNILNSSEKTNELLKILGENPIDSSQNTENNENTEEIINNLDNAKNVISNFKTE